MKWNVLHYNINKQVIEEFDIFNHGGFYKDVTLLLEKDLTKEEFSDLLDKYLMYYFWSKSEYEILVTGWPPSHKDAEKKIDIYRQITDLNWEVFVDYVWSYRRKK